MVDNQKILPLLRGKECVHCTLIIFSFEHDFEYAFSFHSAANLHNLLRLFALPFPHSSDCCTCKHLWTTINVLIVPFLCIISKAVATCSHRLSILLTVKDTTRLVARKFWLETGGEIAIEVKKDLLMKKSNFMMIKIPYRETIKRIIYKTKCQPAIDVSVVFLE